MEVEKVQCSESFGVFGLLLVEDLSNQGNIMKKELNTIVVFLLFHNDHIHVWEP